MQKLDISLDSGDGLSGKLTS